MDTYYVNKNPNPTGEHEVHKQGCYFLPLAPNRITLGLFNNCKEALAEARKRGLTSDGCYHCCKACHTR